MGEASAPHTTRSTFLVRLLLVLAAGIAVGVLSPEHARADGLAGRVTGGAGDTVGSASSTTMEAKEHAVSSTRRAVDQGMATADAARQHAVSSTRRMMHRDGGLMGRGHAGPLRPMPSAAVWAHVTRVGGPHLAHHGRLLMPHAVVLEHRASLPPMTVAATDAVGTAPGPANERHEVSPANRHPVRHGSPSGGATIPAGGGSRDLGGRGGELAAMVFAALLLAGAWSRWRRPWAVARAPNPLVPILVPPG
jgi:hypothetical protein